jgi:hypothetical protein
VKNLIKILLLVNQKNGQIKKLLFFKKMLKQGGRFSIKGEKFYITVPEQVYNQKGELEGVMHNEEADNA